MTDEITNEYTPLQEEFLQALEAQKYPQAQGYLRERYGYCCLGVATRVATPYSGALRLDGCGRSLGHSSSIGHQNQDAPPLVVTRLCMRDENPIIAGETVAARNDGGATHPEIAAMIRAEPWAFFTNFSKPE